MKKTFLVKRNALISSTTVSWGIVALGFSLLLLLLRLIAPNFFWHVTAPVFGLGNTISAANHTFFSSFNDTALLAARNEQLAKENAALQSENQAFYAKETAVNALGTIRGVLAAVVARPPESPYDTLVIAGGEGIGIALGQEAFGEGGVPLGLVTAVTKDYARITLFSAPGTRTYGWAGNANIPLTILGTGAGTMSASLSRSVEVVVGDTVFAPGPGMLPIGSVVRIDSDISSPGMTLRIMPKVNPFSVSWVQVREVGTSVRQSFLLATSTMP